jgi:hypothetical protein
MRRGPGANDTRAAHASAAQPESSRLGKRSCMPGTALRQHGSQHVVVSHSVGGGFDSVVRRLQENLCAIC